MTILNPFPRRDFDLIHAFNRIPLGVKPFIIGFESHLPRAFGSEDSGFFRWMRSVLESPRCRKIIAVSDHARRIFQRQHEGSKHFSELSAKLIRRYPNIEIPDDVDLLAGKPLDRLNISFVGNHFGRKGGCVAVKLAEMANHRGLPLDVEIVSSLQVGGTIWTDPPNADFFRPYIKLLELPNIRAHGSMSNRGVQEVLRRSHLTLLPTFSDTFGYSAIEAMANWAPVIATRQGALPEFIEDGASGVLLDLETTELGEWIHLGRKDRGGPEYEKLYASEVERLARGCFDAAAALLEDPGSLSRLRSAARLAAVARFNSKEASAFWDDLYLAEVRNA